MATVVIFSMLIKFLFDASTFVKHDVFLELAAMHGWLLLLELRWQAMKGLDPPILYKAAVKLAQGLPCIR